MAADDLRHEFHDCRHRFAPVFVDVGDQVRRRQAPHHVELDVLGAADLGHPAQHFAHEIEQKPVRPPAGAETEVADEFGQARHQADDARHPGIPPVLASERIDQRLHKSSPRGLRVARAKKASNTALGSSRSSLATMAICHGITA